MAGAVIDSPLGGVGRSPETAASGGDSRGGEFLALGGVRREEWRISDVGEPFEEARELGGEMGPREPGDERQPHEVGHPSLPQNGDAVNVYLVSGTPGVSIGEGETRSIIEGRQVVNSGRGEMK